MKIKSWHALAILSCAVLTVYYPAFSAPFNSVDDLRLVNHLTNKTVFTWRDLLISDSSSYYRPLVNGSFMLDRLLWGMQAPLMHLENIFLHLLNTLLVYGLACRICAFVSRSGPVLPLLVALLFGVHPLNVEAVTWVSGRADLLAGTFILLTLHWFWLYLAKARFGWLCLAALSFFLGTLAKETTLFLLPGLFLVSLAWTRRSLPSRQGCWSCLRLPCRSILPFLGAVAGYFLLRSWALRGRDLGLKHVARVASGAQESANAASVTDLQPVSLDPWLQAAGEMIKTVGFYAKKLFWPFPLNFGITDVPDYYLWFGFLLVLVMIILLRRCTLAGSLFLTSMSLASIALLVIFGGISWTPVAERYMYAPAALLSLGCAAVAAEFPGRAVQVRLSALALLVLLIFSAGTFQRNLIWQDNVALFEDTIRKSPDFVMARNELAMALISRGDNARAYDILRDLEAPDFQVASLNRIMVLAAEGQLQEARVSLLKRLENPGVYETIIELKLIGVLEEMIGKAPAEQQAREYREEALHYLRRIWERTRDPFFLYRLGQLQMAGGDRAAAAESFSSAAKLFPADSLYREPAQKLAKSLAQ